MKRFPGDHERGTVLVTVALIIVILFGVTGPILLLSMSESRAVDDLTRTHDAFFLAEAGIAAAKYEISEMADPDGDGMGNRTEESATGAYAATAEDIGGGLYQITSRGTAGASNSELQAVVQVVSSTRFPKAAMAIVGDTFREKFKVKKPENIFIDGGDSPAIVASDEFFFNKIYNTFKNAIAKGEMSIDDLKGNRGDKYETEHQGDDDGEDDGQLPVVRTEDYDDSLGDLTGLYDGLLKAVQERLKPAATILVDERFTRGFDGQFGTPEHPEIVYLKRQVDLNNHMHMTGYGTLIVSHELNVNNLSSLDWHGDVIVVGDVSRNAYLRVDNSTLNVTGNVLILGDSKDSTWFVTRNHAQATINGAFFVGTEYTDRRRVPAYVRAYKNTSLTINGVMTMIGKKVELMIYKGADFKVNGMIQIGFPDASKHWWKDEDLVVKLELQGDVDIRKNDDRVSDALNSLYKFGLENNIPDMSNFITREVVTRSWWPTHAE